MSKGLATNEALATKVAEVLSVVCPAFSWAKNTPAVWHGCRCAAQVGEYEPCVCVWHLRDTCLAGQWPQLDFLNRHYSLATKKANEMLQMAKEAIAKAEST